MASSLPAIDIERFRAIGTNVALFHEPLGKPSILYNYCNKAIGKGRGQFLFVCLKQADGTFAFDVSARDPESRFNVREVRSWYYAHRGYWRRFLPKKLKLSPVNASLYQDCSSTTTNSKTDSGTWRRSME